MINIKKAGYLLVCALMLQACKTEQKEAEVTVKIQEEEQSIENGSVTFSDTIKINQIQVVGTHNSYAKERDSVIINFLDPMFSKMMSGYIAKMPKEQRDSYLEFHPNSMSFKEMISYSFPDFPAQLDAGMRSLAIDVVYDPEGGKFSKPAVYDALKAKGVTNFKPFDSTGLNTPGFKVMHIPDIDFLSHYNTLESALTDLKLWSDTNPTHTPIFIMIEAKDKGIPFFLMEQKYYHLRPPYTMS
ncbi:Ca2+-dependent phosphoinositide-specific phospholipase C [Formosa haliotis]|uniref:Ca2+-dependent phosphoinositide-specific phospholipase C n=1 Tax=Formosa haliotis TaxID=1555194 RepID=UPI000824387F|nr:Ca2+-dependent phosphoinositide-specific phospholipase C [Formosa haliotis]